MNKKKSLSFWDTLCEDAAAAGKPINPHGSLLSRLVQTRRLMKLRPGFACVFWLRLNQLFVQKGWRGQFRIRRWRYYRFSNDLSPYATIAPGFCLPHPVDVTVGSTAVIGRRVTLYNGVTIGSKRLGGDAGMPHLGDGVIVYTGAKVFGAIKVGGNSEIGALSLCNKDVPENSVMYGIPPNVTVRPKT